MPTTTQLHIGDAAAMDAVPSESVDLIVTSPPYPMIAMWDDLFAAWAPESQTALKHGRPHEAFDHMHQALRTVWAECVRVLAPGGLCCINIGDATRTVNDTFQLYPNHTRIVHDLVSLGLHQLPGILWRKATNKPNKFMGSGMLPPNAYVTLEHEHILIFRKEDKRTVSPHRRTDRYESAYFWEERNQWFSDVWTDLNGVGQALDTAASAARDRSAAFPLELPLRLIQMYSIAGDTVLDPFWGTGTTSIAAALLRRHSIGYELDGGVADAFEASLADVPSLSRQYNADRLARHRAFVKQRQSACSYHNPTHDVAVMTRNETNLQLYDVKATATVGRHHYQITYVPHDSA